MAMVCGQNPGRICDGCMACQSEPEIAFSCDSCGDDISFGDDYYDVDGNRYCEGCVILRTA